MDIIIAAFVMVLVAPLALALVALGIKGARPIPRWWTARWQRRAYRRYTIRLRAWEARIKQQNRKTVRAWMMHIRALGRARSLGTPAPKRVNRHQRRSALRWGLYSGSPDPNQRTNMRRHGVWAGRKVRNPHPRSPLALRRALGEPNRREIRARFAAAGFWLGTQEDRFLWVPKTQNRYVPTTHTPLRRVDPRAAFLRPVRETRTRVRVLEAHLLFAQRRVEEELRRLEAAEAAIQAAARLHRPPNVLLRLREVLPGADKLANRALNARLQAFADQALEWAWAGSELTALYRRLSAVERELAQAEADLHLAEARAPRRFRAVRAPEEGLFDCDAPWGAPRRKAA